MTMYIVVRFQFEGLHSWPDAPQDRPESYLASVHRHVFHVEAVKLVEHAERDIEIIDYKHQLERYCKAHFEGPHTYSCETMAAFLLELFKLKSCRVLEDNESGALVEEE